MEFKPYHTKYLDVPVSRITLKYRKALNVSASTLIIIVFVGLIPNEISQLGLKFSDEQSNTLIILLGIVNLYFGSAFFLFLYNDYLKNNMEIFLLRFDHYMKTTQWIVEKTTSTKEYRDDVNKLNKEAKDLIIEVQKITDRFAFLELNSRFQNIKGKKDMINKMEDRIDEIKQRLEEIKNSDVNIGGKDFVELTKERVSLINEFDNSTFSIHSPTINKVKWLFFSLIPFLVLIVSIIAVFIQIFYFN